MQPPSRVSFRQAASYAGVSRRVPLDLHKAGLLPRDSLGVFDVVVIQVIERLPLRRSRASEPTAPRALSVADVVRELRAAYDRQELSASSTLVAEPDRCAILDVESALERARKAPDGAVLLPVGSWLVRAAKHFGAHLEQLPLPAEEVAVAG